VLPLSAQDVGYVPQFAGSPLSGQYGSAPQPSSAGIIFASAPSDPTQFPYDVVLFHGKSASLGIRFEISRQRKNNSWGPWRPAVLHRRPNGRFWAKVQFPAASNASLRFRAIKPSSIGSSAFDLYSLETLKYSKSSSASNTGSDVPSAIIRSSAPAVISRLEWKAKPPKETPVGHTPNRMTQHHTAGRQTKTLKESLDEVRFIQDFHQNGRGWSDIGYHFLIDTEGRIFEGRPLTVRGAHVRDANDGNIGIVLMGFHHEPYDHPVTPEQIASITALGQWLVSAYHIDPKTYSGHRDLGKTSCPGDILYSMLGKIRGTFTIKRLSSSIDLIQNLKNQFPDNDGNKTRSRRFHFP
jgi:hypothetical protein